MADGLRVGELLPEVQKKFTQEELDQILRVGSVAFLAGTSHLFLTISEASTMAGQLVLRECASGRFGYCQAVNSLNETR